MAVTMRPISVVVVAYGRDDLLAESLHPLAGAYPVVVVDNARSPKCAELCRSLQVRYVDPGGNLGFAGGVNVGLDATDPSHDVLLLNPDARIDGSALERLSMTMHGEPRVCCTAPAQRHPGTAERQRIGWPFPSPRREWLIALGLGRLVRAEDFVIGAVLLLNRDALGEVGAFDERFFLYAEEADWQRRAVDAGWRAQSVPEVVATHVGAATSTDSQLREAHFYAAAELYVRKWFGSRGWLSYRAAVVVGACARMLLGGAERRDPAARRLRIMLRGPLRHQQELLASGGPT